MKHSKTTQGSPVTHERPRIDLLLVEDDPNDLELSLMTLRKHDLANYLQIVRDGEEALDFLFCRGPFAGRRFEEGPKVVFLDLKLPKINGLEVLREMKADPRTRAVPVVVMTSSREPSDMARGYELGVNSYIQKPIDFGAFQQLIRDLGHYWLFVNQSLVAEAYSPVIER